MTLHHRLEVFLAALQHWLNASCVPACVTAIPSFVTSHVCSAGGGLGGGYGHRMACAAIRRPAGYGGHIGLAA